MINSEFDVAIVLQKIEASDLDVYISRDPKTKQWTVHLGNGNRGFSVSHTGSTLAIALDNTYQRLDTILTALVPTVPAAPAYGPDSDDIPF